MLFYYLVEHFIIVTTNYFILYMKINPLQDRVVVKRKAEEETSKGGIILTAASKEKPNEGKVVAVGPGKTLDNGSLVKPSVKVGDSIVFGRYADSNTIEDGDDELIIMREDDIFGIISQ